MNFKFFSAMAILGFTASQSVAANVWSECVKVVGVSDYRPINSSVIVAMSPQLPAPCLGGGSGIAGAATLQVGSGGVTDDNIKGLLAEVLIAKVTDQKVMIYYDNSSNICSALIVSLGGYSGQCNQ